MTQVVASETTEEEKYAKKLRAKGIPYIPKPVPTTTGPVPHTRATADEQLLRARAAEINSQLQQSPQLSEKFRLLARAVELVATGAEDPNVQPPLHQMSDEQRLAPPSVKWMDRKTRPELADLEAPEFIRAIYGDGPLGDGRLGRGFTQADLRIVDESLYVRFQKQPATAIPPDLDLPTLEEWNTRQLKALGLWDFVISPELRSWVGMASNRAYAMKLKVK